MVYPVLNIMHLEPYRQSSSDLGPRHTKALGWLGFKELPEYNIEHVLQDCWRKARNERHIQEFLMRFMGYNASYDEWLTCKHLKNAPDILCECESLKAHGNHN